MRNGRIISRFLSRNFTNTSQASLFLRQNLHSHFSASCRQVSASPYLAGPRTPPLAREYASMAQESKPTESVSLIVDEISGLTLLEVADLTEVLRKKFDINEMPTMAVMMPGMGFGVRGAAKGGGAAKAEEKKAEKTAFDLKLEGGFDAGNFLGQLRHPNLVKLIGYCCEDEHRLLVYEFMFRGSLENHLFRKATVPLTWSKRMMIALGAAKGLAFLHNAQRPVIYRDFKTSNILLDSDYTAKLSDFGLAKAGPQGDETHVSTRVMGTYGYAAPEYVMTGHLTARSDVYSFGVVLLELLTGRRSVDRTRPSKEQSLVDWARPKLNDKRKLLQIIDPRLENQYSVRAAQKACSLAYYCLSQNPKARPLMSDVVETLEPLQSSSISPNEVSSSSLTFGGGTFAPGRTPDYRIQGRFAGNVGARAGCRSPNPNCSPGGPAACRVR